MKTKFTMWMLCGVLVGMIALLAVPTIHAEEGEEVIPEATEGVVEEGAEVVEEGAEVVEGAAEVAEEVAVEGEELAEAVLPPGFTQGEKEGWEEEVPPGWVKGSKEGWDEETTPPGIVKKAEQDVQAAKGSQKKGKGKKNK